MFCPNCGEKLETPNQSFCAQCGSKIVITQTPEISQEPKVPVEPPPRSTPTTAVSVYDTKPIKSQGTGPYSRKALAFALIWPIFFLIAFYMGFIFTIIRRLSPYMPRNPSLWMVPLILHVIGLVFSILSKVNSSKARTFEGENGLQKAGSIISVFGIVLNVIFLVVVPIMMGTSVLFYDPFI